MACHCKTCGIDIECGDTVCPLCEDCGSDSLELFTDKQVLCAEQQED